MTFPFSRHRTPSPTELDFLTNTDVLLLAPSPLTGTPMPLSTPAQPTLQPTPEWPDDAPVTICPPSQLGQHPDALHQVSTHPKCCPLQQLWCPKCCPLQQLRCPRYCPRQQPRHPQRPFTSRRSLECTPGVLHQLLLLHHHHPHPLLPLLDAPTSSLHPHGSSRIPLLLVLFPLHWLTTIMA